MSNIELKGLKGLRVLDGIIVESKAPKSAFENIQNFPLDFLMPGKYQPRKQLNEEALIELANSIKVQGVIQPLIVRKVEHNKYEIIAGERRWRAARMAGLANIPAIIRDIEDNVVLAFALIENIQREDLSPIEEAQAFSRFKEEFSMTHSNIAEMIGRSRVSVTNTIRLLSLSSPVRKLLEDGRLDMGHARALLTLNPDQQLFLAEKIVEKQLTVRKTEKLVNTIKYQRESRNTETTYLYSDKYYYWITTLSKKFSSNVTIKLNNKGAGKIVIHIDSAEHIDRIIEDINCND